MTDKELYTLVNNKIGWKSGKNIIYYLVLEKKIFQEMKYFQIIFVLVRINFKRNNKLEKYIICHKNLVLINKYFWLY